MTITIAQLSVHGANAVRGPGRGRVTAADAHRNDEAGVTRASPCMAPVTTTQICLSAQPLRVLMPTLGCLWAPFGFEPCPAQCPGAARLGWACGQFPAHVLDGELAASAVGVLRRQGDVHGPRRLRLGDPRCRFGTTGWKTSRRRACTYWPSLGQRRLRPARSHSRPTT
jgi:hypothetical protein